MTARTTFIILLIIATGMLIPARGVAADNNGPDSEVSVPSRNGSGIHGSFLQLNAPQIRDDRTPELPTGRGEAMRPALFSWRTRHADSMRFDGLQPFALALTGGVSTASGEYFDGIGTGAGVQVEVQYRFLKGHERRPTLFLGASYRYSAPSLKTTDFAFYDPNIGYFPVVFEKVRIQHFIGEVGVITKPSETDSYLWLVVGLGMLRTTITAYAPDLPALLPPTDLSDSGTAFRLAFGGVFGLNNKLGLRFGAGVDGLLSTRATEYNYYDNGPRAIGGVFMFDAGLVLEP